MATASQLLELAGKRSPDVCPRGISGGPPCQGFSRGNVYAHPDDPQNLLPLKYAEILASMNAQLNIEFFIFENVWGLAAPKHRARFERIKRSFSEAGFRVFQGGLNARHFGVPQSRQRALVEEVGARENPRLETALDNYLRTLWTLSLSAPLEYINKHPFDLDARDEPRMFELTAQKGTAREVKLGKNEKLRDHLGLHAPERGTRSPFHVIVDEIELLRPIRFCNLPTTTHAIQTPLLFVGKAKPDLSTIARDERGGDLAFEAYFLWTPKIVPKEHNGLLVRISDASGTLLDESFMKYQVSEQTRLRQLTAEVFVSRGLDPALNIDRESVNYAHPHCQYLMKWVHRALRQLANTHKQLASEIRTERREEESEEESKTLRKFVREEYRRVGGDAGESPPEVVFAEKEDKDVAEQRKRGALAFDAKVVLATVSKRTGKAQDVSRMRVAEKTKAVAQILKAYGVFENMPRSRQQELLRAIVAVFAGEGVGDGE